MTDSELLTTIFGSETHPLRLACAGWIESSRPFRSFLDANAGKIRKKARQASDAESLRDLQLEMDAAYHLLADRRVELAYERYLAEKLRGPDFTVTFKGYVVFNVEVRRLRPPVPAGKFGDGICGKLRQMPPNAINVLLVGVDASAPRDLDSSATVKRLIQRAESKQDDFFIQRGFRDARDFLRAFQRLSGLLLRANWYDAPATSPDLWLNPQAKHPLPSDVQKLLQR
jgi:hypothetical protein